MCCYKYLCLLSIRDKTEIAGSLSLPPKSGIIFPGKQSVENVGGTMPNNGIHKKQM